MQNPQLIILAILALTLSPSLGKAVVGPAFHEDKSHPPAASIPEPEYQSVDQIKGVGKFKFGSKLTDFPPGLLRIIDPKAKGGMLKVCPYGDNYLVTDLTGLTWGNIPLTALVVTFREGVLIDLQMLLKSKKVDFYIAARAFKEKYGPSALGFPVETWNGSNIQVSMIFEDNNVTSSEALETPSQAKLEFFDHGQWSKFEAEKNAKVNKLIEKNYDEVGDKVKTNL